MRAFVFAALCAAAFTLPCFAASQTGRWTQFRGHADNNAVVDGNLRVQWEVPTDGRISASPTFAHGTLFVGTNSGTLYAINIRSGQILWKQHVSNALMSAPLLYRGLVIVGEGNAANTGESALIAFDQRSGVRRWTAPLKGSGMPTPAIVANVLVHHDASGLIAAMDPMTGRVLYERNVHSLAFMSAALPMVNGRFVTAGVRFNSVLEVDAHNGEVVWSSNPFPANASGVGDCPLASDGSRIFGDYVVPDSGGSHADVGDDAREHAYALDARTGALLWDVALQSGPLPINNQASIPVAKNGIVYVGDSSAPWVNALDARTGRMLWQKATYGAVKGAFSIRRNVMYFGDASGYLWALDARSGKRLGVKSMPTSFNVGSPIIVGETLIIGSFTGSVYAVPLNGIRN